MAIWTVYLGSDVVHKPVTTERNVTAATLEVALDSAGALTLDVPVSHPLYGTIASLPLLGPAAWRVTRDGAEVFRGRTLSRERLPLDGTVRVVAEGDLAMLNDTLLEPYSFSGSPYDYLKKLVDAHNAQADPWKRFTVGSVTAYDTNDYIVRSSDSRVQTWEELANKTFGSSTGGHIVLRRGTHVIDWLASVDSPCTQPVRIGYNLLDMSDAADGAELVTAIRPLGAEVNGAPVELASTRGAAGYTYSDGILRNDALVASNGTIVREVVWDEVTTEAVLWQRALAHVKALALPRSVTVTAIDMSDAGYAVDAFDLGQLVALDALGTTGTMQVVGIEWDMLDPSGGSITFGGQSVTLTRSASGSTSQGGVPEAVESTDTKSVSNSTNTTLTSITLTAGTWLVTQSVLFASNNSGRRVVYVSTSSSESGIAVAQDASTTQNATSGGTTKTSGSAIVSPTSSTTYFLRCWQNSGSTLTVDGHIRAAHIA